MRAEKVKRFATFARSLNQPVLIERSGQGRPPISGYVVEASAEVITIEAKADQDSYVPYSEVAWIGFDPELSSV